MNRLVLFPSQEVSKDTFEVTDSQEIVHLAETLRCAVGDTLRVAVVNRGLGEMKVVSLKKNRVILVLASSLRASGLRVYLRVLAALTRPLALRRMMEQGASMGVSSFLFFGARGSEKSYAHSKVLKKENYQKILAKGIGQSKNLFLLPSVSVKEELPKEGLEGGGKRLILCPEAKATLWDVVPLGQRITLGLGPDRGWHRDEKETLLAQGFIPLRIADHTLRTEVALTVALAQMDILGKGPTGALARESQINCERNHSQ